MPQTIRKYWAPHKGRVTFNYNWAAIDQDSVVLVTASEYNNQQVRFIGAASVTVSNIAPHGPPYDLNHGVTFVVNVDWPNPLPVVTDITVVDAKPVEVQLFNAPMPRSIGMKIQYQQTRQWCWIAAALSVNHFYNPASTWTQCQVMTVVGQNINGFPQNTSACPTAQVLAANPGLAGILANPYDKAAEYILDTPSPKVDMRYIKSGGVSDPLKVTGNFASIQPGNLSLAQVAAEVNAGRPVLVDITWNSGGSHVVAIAGVMSESIIVLDPVNGQSVMLFESFPASYYGGATLDDYVFTKP